MELNADSHVISSWCIIFLVFAFSGSMKECLNYLHFSKQKDSISLYCIFFLSNCLQLTFFLLPHKLVHGIWIKHVWKILVLLIIVLLFVSPQFFCGLLYSPLLHCSLSLRYSTWGNWYALTEVKICMWINSSKLNWYSGHITSHSFRPLLWCLAYPGCNREAVTNICLFNNLINRSYKQSSNYSHWRLCFVSSVKAGT